MSVIKVLSVLSLKVLLVFEFVNKISTKIVLPYLYTQITKPEKTDFE